MRLLLSPFFEYPGTISARVIRRLGMDARPSSFVAAAHAASHYDFAQWRAIRCPVLATRGDNDIFTPRSDLVRLAAVVPHAQMVTIPCCGHFANIERPEHVQKLLEGPRSNLDTADGDQTGTPHRRRRVWNGDSGTS